MRLSNFLVGMLACAAITACSNDDNGNATNNGTESDGNTYLAVNLVANNDAMTRAFENGTEAESTVTKARFYFFNGTGAAYPVSNGVNYIDVDNFTWTPDPSNSSSTNGQNVTTSSNIVLVLNGVDAVPSSVVVVLNPPTALLGSSSMTLSALRENTADYANSSYTSSGTFVMSNSVYVNEGNIIDAVNIQGNLETSAAAANLNPVQISVERAVAKVSVTQQAGASNPDTGIDFGTETNANVYAKIIGWTLANVRPATKLLKELNNSWLQTQPFAGWNSATDHRSYWAEGVTTAVTNTNSWDEITDSNDKYCNENAGSNNTTTTLTQLLVAAQLVDSEGNPVEIAEIMSRRMTVAELKDWILGALEQQHYIAYQSGTEPTNYTQIDADDIDFRAKAASDPSSVRSYEAIATLASGAPAQLYERQSDGTYSTVTDEVVNEYLAEYVARIWKNGMTYYFTPIQHLGNMSGVVRNHLYQINIQGVSGLGTPVYDPDSEIIPEEVIDQHSYLSAQINILAWNVVSNNVTLGQ